MIRFILCPCANFNSVRSIYFLRRFVIRVYLCYRLETQDGKLLDGSLGNYKVKETIYRPDGTSGSFTYGNNNNWISECFSQGGTYRGVVEISGDYTGSVEVSYNMPQPYKVILTTWFSDSPMGKEINSVEKGKEYYYCYTLVANEKGYYNQSINTDYKATQEIYAPDGIKIGTWTKDKTDHKDTRKLLEKLLHMLAEQGEETVFCYVRREILKKK